MGKRYKTKRETKTFRIGGKLTTKHLSGIDCLANANKFLFSIDFFFILSIDGQSAARSKSTTTKID